MWKPRAAPNLQSATSPDQYERLFWDAVKAGNQKEVATHLGSTFICVTPQGQRDRAAVLDEARKLRLTTFEISNLESVPAGDNMVVTYTLVLHGSLNGQPLPEQPARVLTVWRVAPRGWVEMKPSKGDRAATPPPTPTPDKYRR